MGSTAVVLASTLEDMGTWSDELGNEHMVASQLRGRCSTVELHSYDCKELPVTFSHWFIGFVS